MSKLAQADGERIETTSTATPIVDTLLEAVPSADNERVRAAAAHHGQIAGGEADGLASSVLADVPGASEWAQVADAAQHRADGVPVAAIRAVVDGAVERAADADGIAERHVGAALREFAERFSRHTAEADLTRHFSDASLAGLALEHENVDVTCDAGNAQVYTGTSSKAWYHKAGHDTKPDDYEQAVEDCNFDVFVFVRNDEEGVLKVGAKKIENESETSAYAKSGH